MYVSASIWLLLPKSMRSQHFAFKSNMAAFREDVNSSFPDEEDTCSNCFNSTKYCCLYCGIAPCATSVQCLKITRTLPDGRQKRRTVTKQRRNSSRRLFCRYKSNFRSVDLLLREFWIIFITKSCFPFTRVILSFLQVSADRKNSFCNYLLTEFWSTEWSSTFDSKVELN